MKAEQHVLVTGSAGLVGSVLRRGLAERYRLTGIDLRDRPRWGPLARLGGKKLRAGDMRCLEANAAAFQGVDAVVDLAAHAAADTTWPLVHRDNLPATFNALEAARRAGVRRVVFASSNHVTGGLEREQPYASIVAGRYDGLDPGRIPRITTNDPVRPDGPYAVAKLCGEALGRFFVDEHGLSVICLRIGTVNPEDRPTQPRHFATLLTHRDLVQLVDRCLAAPDDVRFGVYYGVSGNTWRIWDIDDARQDLGYEPADDAEKYRC